MKKTFLLLFFLLLILRGYTTAQNPYESLGKVAPVLTLSEGKYQEFMTNDTIVQIGSVLFNTITKEVVAFQDDTLGRMDADMTTRFLSVDPIGRKYPELTPYQFASNTPIQALDLDGLEAYDYRLYLNDKGQTQSFEFVGENTYAGLGWSVWNIIGYKIPAIDVYQNGKHIGRYTGFGGNSAEERFGHAYQFAYDEDFRNKYMSENETYKEYQDRQSKEISSTFDFKRAAVLKYAFSRADARQITKKITKSTSPFVNETADALNNTFGKDLLGNDFVKDVESPFKFTDKNGKGRKGDIDIVTEKFFIEVKSGHGKGSTSQTIKNKEYAETQGKIYIFYNPDNKLGTHVEKGLRGITDNVFRNQADLIKFVGEHR